MPDIQRARRLAKPAILSFGFVLGTWYFADAINTKDTHGSMALYFFIVTGLAASITPWAVWPSHPVS